MMDGLPVSIGGLQLQGTDEFGVRWVMQSFDGWGTPKPKTAWTQRTRRNGANKGETGTSNRNLAAAGSIYAPTPELLVSAFDRLFAAVSVEDTLLVVDEPGLTRHITVARSDEILPKYVTDKVGDYSIQVASEDWRKFGADVSGSTFLPSSSGGLTIPFTIPFTINAVQVSGQVSLVNPGNDTGPVKLRIDGPCQGPVITHVGSGLALVFSSSLVLGAGEWLDIDMEAQTVLANGQSSRSGYVTSRGWSGFEPGSNTWSFTAQGYDPASKLTVTGTPAWQ
jgi:hypothetical protein